MTVRFLIVAIDDAKPLGPQMRAALGVLSWETVRQLCGNRYSLRWLRRLLDSSEISERRTVAFGSIFPASPEAGGSDAMSGLFGGGASSAPWIPEPTPPVRDDSAQEEAARKERLADLKGTGRGATILTDYALATSAPSVLKPTLGA